MKEEKPQTMFIISLVGTIFFGVLLCSTDHPTGKMYAALTLSIICMVISLYKWLTRDLETKKENVKEEGRYYFYEDRCSFKLAKEEIIDDNAEKGGMKHSLTTLSMGMIIIEIRPCMPNFGGNPTVTTKNMEIASYPGLEASIMGITHQYYINCGSFVVQVDNASEEFLNSFRKEK